MRYIQLERVLYDNPLKDLNRKEQKEYLFQWNKKLRYKVIIICIYLCFTFYLSYLFILRFDKSEVIKQIAGVAIVLVLLGEAVRSIIIIKKEIMVYRIGKMNIWQRSLAYIEENKRGELKISYINEGNKCTSIIENPYGEDSRRLAEGTYITFITISTTEPPIILKDIGWHK